MGSALLRSILHNPGCLLHTSLGLCQMHLQVLVPWQLCWRLHQELAEDKIEHIINAMKRDQLRRKRCQTNGMNRNRRQRQSGISSKVSTAKIQKAHHHNPLGRLHLSYFRKNILLIRRVRNKKTRVHNYLQCHNHTVYYLWFNKRLVPLNIDNNVIMFPELLKCLAAAFRSCILNHMPTANKEITKQSWKDTWITKSWKVTILAWYWCHYNISSKSSTALSNFLIIRCHNWGQKGKKYRQC